jgi:hypothetical protein
VELTELLELMVALVQVEGVELTDLQARLDLADRLEQADDQELLQARLEQLARLDQ